MFNLYNSKQHLLIKKLSSPGKKKQSLHNFLWGRSFTVSGAASLKFLSQIAEHFTGHLSVVRYTKIVIKDYKMLFCSDVTDVIFKIHGKHSNECPESLYANQILSISHTTVFLLFFKL